MKTNVLRLTWEKRSSKQLVLALLEGGKSSLQKNHECVLFVDIIRTLSADAAVDYRRHARVSLDAPIPLTCLKDGHCPRDSHSRGLYPDARDMCRTKEYT